MENVDPAEALAGDRTKVADTLFLGQIYRTCHSRSTCAQDFLGNGSSAVDLISASTTDAPASAKALAHASPIFEPDTLKTATTPLNLFVMVFPVNDWPAQSLISNFQVSRSHTHVKIGRMVVRERWG